MNFFRFWSLLYYTLSRALRDWKFEYYNYLWAKIHQFIKLKICFPVVQMKFRLGKIEHLPHQKWTFLLEMNTCSITRVTAHAGVKNELRFPIMIGYVKFINIGAAGPPSYRKWTCPQIYLGYFSEHFQQKKNIRWTFFGLGKILARKVNTSNNSWNIDFSENFEVVDTPTNPPLPPWGFSYCRLMSC